ncbi:AI-2E family transporter [Streptococcus hillyeri]|uniref:AI-2E family transporter n=1 Tax=Streptococcus hillyeri TaxID=2282420 RepID=A0A3L9DLN5_9STRE|nr:AI-2E family transporter [Streptococcus hillyeri]RLY02436.1 AI-2E family transporter [Streptococcus hillyeri]
MNFEKKHVYYIVVAFILCYMVQAYWSTGARLVGTVWTAGQPFLIGAAIAYIVNIVMSAYERLFGLFLSGKRAEGAKRGLSLVLAYLTFVVIIVWIFSIVLPDLISSIKSLLTIDTSGINQWINDLNDNKYVAKLLNYLGEDTDLATTISSYSQQILKQVLTVLTGILSSVSSIASTLLNVFVSLIFSLYVLGNKETLIRQVGLLTDTYLGKYASKVRYVVKILDNRFHGFLVSQTLEAMILGSLTALGMKIFGFPYAATVGVLVAFTAIIPVVGAYIGLVIGFILLATQSISQALWFVVFLVVLQQFEGNLIYPRVVGGSIGLPGMWVLVAITLGGALAGIPGMLVAVPLAASLYQIIKDHVVKKNSQ